MRKCKELRIFGEMRVEEDKEHICAGGGGGLVEGAR